MTDKRHLIATILLIAALFVAYEVTKNKYGHIKPEIGRGR